jgi:hypothetical protein
MALVFIMEWIVSFAPQAARGLDGRGKLSGTRFLCKKPVPEPSGKNSNIFTVNWKRTYCRVRAPL